ncbi:MULTISPECIES: hypothetical protein [Bacillaceae]|uniref:hypothetical protein n=1 Tax=Bacillaceae TaxID=186817 RepID=UPI000BFC7F9B|nr:MULTISPECIES: hypothetical protein [Bacillaceae]PGT89023.1 hypothetical protein COD11_04935 [Bacillus sp. AFS040349]UGB29645.1 hypothetical protein LPC09_18115 [Metabacillus sp. B2-18]UGB32430.1 hypothetical protein LPC09_08375 [Metabacillus sp. B2-18]
MRKITLLLSLTLLSAILFGCQSEDSTTTDAANTNAELQSEGDAEITKISISKSKGVSPTVFEEDKDVETFKSIISSAVKEDGIANMANPEYYLDVIYINENKQSYHLWIGEKGQKSTLMKTDDTHTIYTVSEEMTDKLIELIE